MILCNGSILGGVGAGLAIQGFARLGLLDSKAPGRLLAYLGSRSYSIYLVHVLVGSNLARLLLRLNWVTETFLVLVGFFRRGPGRQHHCRRDPLSIDRMAHAPPRAENLL